jgi:hypothetical protein
MQKRYEKHKRYRYNAEFNMKINMAEQVTEDISKAVRTVEL